MQTFKEHLENKAYAVTRQCRFNPSCCTTMKENRSEEKKHDEEVSREDLKVWNRRSRRNTLTQMKSSAATAVFKAQSVQRREASTSHASPFRGGELDITDTSPRRRCHRFLSICYTLFKWGNKKLLMTLHLW